MPVYVDKSANSFGRMVMCHMIADTPWELLAMVLKIGVDQKWFQADASMPHFDIAKSKRALAIAAGALELDRRPFVDAMKRIKQTWPVEKGKWSFQ
jgi:hypothetical protein